MEKDYLGFVSDIEITDDDIAFLLDGMKPSDITAKIGDDELNEICDFYNGKVVCLEFDEFRCKTFGKCHGVKVVDDKFVFLFKHVIDIYDDNFECNESKDDEFVEVEVPYDVYIYCVIHCEKQLFSDKRMPVDEAKDMVETIIDKIKTLK